MYLHKWEIETIVCFSDFERKTYSFQFETLTNDVPSALRIAKFKTTEQLKENKKTVRSIHFCWIQNLGFRFVSKFEQYCNLVKKEKTSKVIMVLLQLSEVELAKFEYLRKNS